MFTEESYPERGFIATDYLKKFVTPGCTNKLHRHPCCGLMVIERGEVAVTALGNTIRVGGGAVIFHPPGVIYKHFTSSNELYERYRIRFYPELLGGVSENIRDCISAHTVKTLSHSDFEDVLSLTRMLHKRCQGEGAASVLSVSLLTSLLSLVFGAESREVREPEGYIHKVTEYIRENCQDKLTAADVAKHFFVSRGKLNYDLKSYSDMTVSEYITLARIELAKELLSRGYSVALAAERSGFSTASYFIKVFSAYTGVTPLKFRTENVKK